MKIKLIDFGLEKDHYPFRPHENDAGADVYMPYDGMNFSTISGINRRKFADQPFCGHAASWKNITSISNVSSESQTLLKDIRVGQLVITPVLIADFVLDLGVARDIGAFGSTGE